MVIAFVIGYEKSGKTSAVTGCMSKILSGTYLHINHPTKNDQKDKNFSELLYRHKWYHQAGKCDFEHVVIESNQCWDVYPEYRMNGDYFIFTDDAELEWFIHRHFGELMDNVCPYIKYLENGKEKKEYRYVLFERKIAQFSIVQ